MAKKIITVICVLLLTTALLVGCGGYAEYGPVGGSIPTGEVENNGGLAVKKGDYYYVVNAYEYENASNSFPNVVRGGVTRVDSNFENPVLIVPKIVSFSTTKAGIYIFGDYVYYFSPGTDKDENGNVKYYERIFTKTKLDGTGTTDLVKILNTTLDYSMMEVDGVPYLIYISNNQLIAFNTVNSSSKVLQKSVTAFACSDESIYYTRDVYTDSITKEEVEYDATKLNKEEITKQGYNCFAKMSPNGEEIVLIKGSSSLDAVSEVSFQAGKVFYRYMGNLYYTTEANATTEGIATVTNRTLVTTLSGISNLTVVSDSCIVATYNSKTVMFDSIGTDDRNPYPLLTSAPTFVGVVNEGGEDYLYYITSGTYKKYDEEQGGNVKVEISNGLYRVKILEDDASIGKGEIVAYFEMATTNALPEIIGNNIFFMMNKVKDRVDNEDTDDEVTVREWYINYTYAYNFSSDKTEEQKLNGATLLIGESNVLESDKPSND